MNPYADLVNLSDDEIAALPPEPEHVAVSARALFMLADRRRRSAGADDFYVSPAWPVGSCFDIGALGTAVGDATGGAL